MVRREPMTDWQHNPEDYRLIIMSCSGMKRTDHRELPAIDRYDGPMWKTLRVTLAKNDAASAAIKSKQLRIWVLSGKYGFIDHITHVPNYEKRMTPEILVKMATDCSYDFQRIPSLVNDARNILFAGGEMYRNAMWKASGSNLWNIMKITETDGGGIGVQRQQLASWIDGQFPKLENAS